MATKRSQLGIIFLTIFIDLVGFGIVIPVLPRYAEHFGASPWEIGWLVGVFSLAQFICSPLWGQLSDKIGRKPVLIISTIGTAIGFFMMGWANTLLILFAARLIDGISGGNIGTAQAYIADISAPEERAKRMGLIGAAFGLGFIFGPAIGGWTATHYGWGAPMLVAGAMAAVNAILVTVVLPESLPPEKRQKGPKERLFPELFRHVDKQTYLTVMITYFLMIAGFSLMTSLFALFLFHRYDLDAKSTGNILALIGLIGALIQGGLIGRLSKRFGDGHLASAGALLLGAGFVALPFTSHVGTMIGACVLVAVGNSLMMPTLSAISSRSADGEWQGRALGVMQSAGSLARWIGPTVAGALLMLDLASGKEAYARTPFFVAAGFMVFAFLLSLRLPRGVTSKS
jgi:multidrug resistance protein